MLVDSGSDVSILRQAGGLPTRSHECDLRAVEGGRVVCEGLVEAEVEGVDGGTQSFHVCQSVGEDLLGADVLQVLGAKVNFSEQQLEMGQLALPFLGNRRPGRVEVMAPSNLEAVTEGGKRSYAEVLVREVGGLSEGDGGSVIKVVKGCEGGATRVGSENGVCATLGKGGGQVAMKGGELSDVPWRPGELGTDMDELFARTGAHLEEGERLVFGCLLREFGDVFASGSLGRTDLVEHAIELENTQPIRLPGRRLPNARWVEVQKMLVEMEKDGVIERSFAPWSSPIVIVPKKDGSLRMCVDYRLLNGVTRKDAYPLPLIQDVLSALAGSAYFSTLDLASGYWQVPMRQCDRQLTTFAIQGLGLWQFKVMPFGLIPTICINK
jgi:hypothetical protein